jgi:pyrimidine deaminase RibD-like protein
MKINEIMTEGIKQRLDPKCWKGKHKEGTKIKGGVRVNNCVPNESVAEDQSDYEIRNLEKLDSILAILCKMVIEGQQEDSSHFGMVAAGVLDPDNNLVAEVNYPQEDGLRVHAERAAMEAYSEKYGDIPAGSIIITTLSPCSEHDDITGQHRVGESCTDLINNSNIHKVYCGYMDPSQGDDEHDERTFTLQETNNQQIRDLCKQFADTFLEDEIDESAAWRRKEGKNKKGGLNAKGVASYRRENPGSKLQMAVTTKPSKLKKGSKAAKRRKSFCARMGGMKGPMKKPNGKPTRKALALRKWNC